MYLFQMKKANFDVSHELDEFLMVEKPLTHTKRKQHPDLEKMRPELRQLEEQYVGRAAISVACTDVVSCRFTVYDFSKSKRISYYPHNQPITNGIRQDESEGSEVIQSTTNTLVPSSTLVDRSRPGSPLNEDDAQQYMHSHPPLPSLDGHGETSDDGSHRRDRSSESTT